MSREIKFPGQKEFIVLVALMMALVALAIDMMLPALPMIGKELGVTESNDNQLIISILFLGIAFGQLFYGPFSDSFGRKLSIYIGFGLFLFGCGVSLWSQSLEVMLMGRFIQGFGLAGPRIMSVTLVRDHFGGAEMAKVMSLVMAIFIIVPIIAPALGQLVLNYTVWKVIFIFFIIYATLLLIWFTLRMPETLTKDKAHPFSFKRIGKVIVEISKNRISMGYTIASGFVSSLFLGYLNSSQQLFQDAYKMGESYALIFALLAFAVGLGSFLNGQVLVKRFGMKTMVRYASFSMIILSSLFYILTFRSGGLPELWQLLTFFVLILFHNGILFGNLNSLAMEPLGHVAGIGSTIVGALTTFISVPFGIVIGLSYNDTVNPLIIGFIIFSTLSFLVIYWAGNKKTT
jgi:DHA1 family bicyclomycin/chloramphenicol resistance-like MFS transporter